MPVRVALVDDHTLLRQAVRRMLGARQDMRVVAEGGSGADAMRIASVTRPDVLVIDLYMPDDGLSAIVRICRDAPDNRILVLTAAEDSAPIEAALAAGAAGVVSKSADASTLIEAIRTVHAGRRFICPIVRRFLSREQPDLGGLSPREQQVLHGVGLGHTNREMAEQMGVSVKTVEGYRARLRNKLGVDTRAELVELARQLKR